MFRSWDQNDRQTVKAANGILLFTLFIYMGSSFLFEGIDLLLGHQCAILQDSLVRLVAGQLLLLAPSVCYLIKKRRKITSFLHIRPIRLLSVLACVVFAYAISPVIAFCNYMSLQVSDNVIDTTIQDILGHYPLAVAVFCVAFLPCFVEEFLFRGVLFQSYRKSGFLKAALLSGLLFGLFHMNLNQMSYAVVAGVLFAALNEASGSLISSMLVHFIINGTSLISTAVLLQQPGGMESAEAQTAEVDLFSMGCMALIGLVIVVLLLCVIAKIEGRWDDLKEKWRQDLWIRHTKISSPTLIMVVVVCVIMMALVQLATMLG